MCALLLASGVSQAATHEPLRILSYELFAPRAETAVGQQKIGGTTSTRFKFDAFGRHFGLTLEKNTSLADWVEAKSPTLSVYRGTLDNVPGSWARMSAKGQQIRGMIWDGHDLFIVDAAAAAETDASTSKDQTIIYRLADTQIEPGVAFCGTEAVSGKAAYSALVDELKGSPVLMQAAGASLRLEISALADSLLRARYSDDEETRDEILARLNNVDGIFSSQIGVEIQIPSFDIDDETTQQLSQSTNPNTLVKNLASVRSKTPALRSRGLSHLFTGRDLDGTTVGIAFTDSLCSTQWGVGLTQMGRSVGIDSLITAHEIGHNFGAVHDGDKQCSGTPLNQFIMSPTVSPNATTFSSCSLDAILPRKRTASCLAVLPPPDLSLSSNVDNKSATIHQPVDWTVIVANIGGSGAQAARLVVNAPPAVIIKNVSLDSSQCSQSGGSLTCELGDIAARGLREIRGVLEGTAAGTYTLTAQVTASNESSMSNNKVQGTLTITPEVDVAVSLTAPDSAVVGTGVTLTFSV
ncbi:MAG: M12 family metallo-peptidase, partial [Povalibacter sp.]